MHEGQEGKSNDNELFVETPETERPYGDIEYIVRGLGRTVMVGRNKKGHVVSEEGLRVAEMMRENQLRNDSLHQTAA